MFVNNNFRLFLKLIYHMSQ